MSNAIYPVLPGLTYNNTWTPVFSTKIHAALSGKEQRAAFWSYPRRKYTLTYEVLRTSAAYLELQILAGFFLARQGSFDSWLYSDPNDNSVTGQSIGTCDGTTTAFQLVRAYGAGGFSYIEPMQNINGTPIIRVAGVVKTAGVDYTINATGIVTFTSAPAASAAITADFSFYFRCRFLNDEQEFAQFNYNMWEARQVQFETLK